MGRTAAPLSAGASWLAVLGCVLALPGCTAGPAWNAAAEQALADGRASMAAIGAPPPAEASAPREPGRIRPLRTVGLRPAPEPSPNLAPGAAVPANAGSLPINAAGLGGSAPDRLIALLGEPALRRSEGPVSIWLYSAAGCQLDVMFYPSAEGPRVAHVQARAGGFAQRTEAACLHDLAAQARRRPPAASRRQGLSPEPIG